jgi:hypothetical protein
LNLADLGLPSKQFRALRAQGYGTLGDLFKAGPTKLAKRKSMWKALSSSLKKVAERCPDLAEEVQRFLAEGDGAHEEHAKHLAERQENDPDHGLPQDERQLLRVLRQANSPKPLRNLRRELKSGGRFKPLKPVVRASQKLIIYPFGIHNWVGLKEWGQEGYLKAARGSWTVLPVHLNRILSEGRAEDLGDEGWKAVTTVALERKDKEVLLMCQGHLPEAEVVPPEPRVAPPEKEVEPPELPARPLKEGSRRDEFLQLLRRRDQKLKAQREKIPDPEPQRQREEPEIVVDRPASTRSSTVPLRTLVDEALEGEQLRVFAGLDPGTDTIKAVEVIRNLASTLPSPFSLAELQPTAGDLGWLKSWARGLEVYKVRGWFNSHSSGSEGLPLTECLGVLLLFLVSEEARRRGSEGRVWTEIPACFQEDTRTELFTGGQPRVHTRQAIEAGARRLMLHHAFGKEGRQSWYLTAFLQFGFTRQKIPYLPLWLSRRDQMSESCLQLLEDSDTFRRLWEALIRYRKDPGLAAETERILSQNSYIINDWIPEILGSAKRELSQEVLEQSGGSLPLVYSPRLAWSPPDPPSWGLRYFDLCSHDLSDSGYDVEVNDEAVGRIFRLSDGTLSVEPPELSGPLLGQSVEVSLLSEHGEDDRAQDVDFWQDDEDIVAFEVSTGQRMRSANNLSPNRSYILVLDGGLSLSSPPRARHLVGDRTVYYLEAPWPAATAVVDSEGRVVDTLAAAPKPSWLKDIQLSYPTIRGVRSIGDSARLNILSVPSDVEVAWVRFEGKNLEVQTCVAGYEFTLVLPPNLTGPRVSVRLCLRQGSQKFYLRLSAQVSIFDASISLTSQSWERFDGLEPLKASELEQARCRFFLQSPEWPEARHWAIMEGSSFAERPRKRVFKLTRPAGFGAPLTLIQGPYNSDFEVKTLVKSVVQTGIVSGLTRRYGRWNLWLNRPVEADEDHQIVIWGGRGELVTLAPDQLFQCEGRTWIGELPEAFCEQQIAMGIAYRGQLLGSYWDQSFDVPWSCAEPRFAAGLARWFRLPLLADDWLPGTQEFAQNHSADTLSAWLFDNMVRGCPELILPNESDDWFCVIRSAFLGWRPSNEEASSVWGLLCKSTNPGQVFNTLLQADPDILRELIAKNFFARGELRFFQAWTTLSMSEQELTSAAARDMRVSEHFVKHLCQASIKGSRALDKKTAQNIEVAKQLGSFSRLLISQYLTEHCLQLNRRRR